jgi:NAD(P)H-flavin reductase/ferredoxin
MASLLLTLLALALLRPALSQAGAADLGVAVAEVQLDWFLLPLLPLIDLWPLWQVWMLVAGVTGLLIVLPWLPPKFGRGPRGAYQLTIHPTTTPMVLRSGETLLEAGLRHGLALPYECRNGACGVCMCTVLHGSVDHGIYQRSALPDALRAQGRALMCCATPLSDLDIEVEPGDARPRPPVGEHRARVARIEPLSADVVRLTLVPVDGAPVTFVAGQYVNILLDDGQRRAFSFANPPQTPDHIELHVRRVPGGRFTGHVFTQMKVGDTLRFEGPLGDFRLRDSDAPILFVAGATGFAPIKSIVEDAFARAVTRPMWLYWGVRRRADLYAAALAEQWQREHANFHFVPVLSDPDPTDAWSGRTGLVHQAMLADFADLREHEVYVCGSVKMVEAAVPAFLAQGLGEGFCFSDAFVPAAPPR